MDSEQYRRTLRFGVAVAAQLALPDKTLRGGHTVGDGHYFAATGAELSSDDVKKIGDKLQAMVAAGAKIAKVAKPWKEMVDYFDKHGLSCAKALITTRIPEQVDCYECEGVLRLALHPLYESLFGLKENNDGKFSLIPSAPGFIASYSKTTYAPQPALLAAHQDHIAFGKSWGVDSVGALNALQQVGRPRKDFVLQCEFRQEQKLANIAADVVERSKKGSPVKVICIAGPTSSGKTTFANKLCMYLQNSGYVAKALSVDHYYLPLDRQPKYRKTQKRSDVDYDHIESMDVDLVGEHLNKLARGQSVVTPVYDMKSGYRKDPGEPLEALPSNGILVIEGIHALNPLYTQAVDASMVYKVFISPLTAMQMDDHNAVKTTNHRLLRRMCRDYLFRAHSASRTLSMWNNVRRGEGFWIFPHQNNADFVMNSCAEYEVPVLKTFLEPLLRAVTPDDANWAKAREMLALLDNFGSWPPELTPGSALLREFIGDGSFDCH